MHDIVSRAPIPFFISSLDKPSIDLLSLLNLCHEGIYSSRKISQATREDINLLWLTGMHPIDHNTINRFRFTRINPVFEQVFTSVVMLLVDAGVLSLDTYFLDGTKIEANAGKKKQAVYFVLKKELN